MLFYSKQLEWIAKAESAAQTAQEIMVIIGSTRMPAEVQAALRDAYDAQIRERAKWDKKLAGSFN